MLKSAGRYRWKEFGFGQEIVFGEESVCGKFVFGICLRGGIRLRGGVRLRQIRLRNPSSGRNSSSEFVLGGEFVCGEFVFASSGGMVLENEFVFGIRLRLRMIKCYAPSGHTG